MPPRKKTAAAPSLNLALLASIVAATNSGQFLYVSEADAAPLLTHVPPLVEVNTTMLDANGARATRATTDGVTMVANAGTGTPAAGAASAPATTDKPKFNIVMASVPTIKRGGGGVGTETYPFAELPAPANGQSPSFFVPVSAERPDPSKSLASTVSSATRRFSELDPVTPTKTVNRAKRGDDGKALKDAAGKIIRETVTIDNLKPTRVFCIRKVEDGAPWGFPGQKGAAIYRTA